MNITRLNIIHDQDSCVQKMCKLRSKYEWKRGFETAGIQYSAPALPMQAILLTMRIVKDNEKCLQDVILLLDGIERDPLCTYVLYVAIVDDEYSTPEACRFKDMLKSRPHFKELLLLRYPRKEEGEAPRICQILVEMAKCAFKNGAN